MSCGVGIVWVAATALFASAVLSPIPAHAAVTISAGATQNMTCSNGVCTPTAKTAVLNAGDLETMLASGNVEVSTTGSGIEANDLLVSEAFTWSNTSSLSLTAHRSIAINKPVAVTGSGGLTLTDGGPQRLSFGAKGNITFANLSSILSVNGANFTLVNDIKSLAAAIKKNPGGDYALAASYDASKDGTYSSAPIAITFSGTFEGLGNAISNLSISDGQFEGIALFANAGTGSTLDDINLVNASVQGTLNSRVAYSVGGLVATSGGTMFGDSVSGNIEGGGGAIVGGLASTASGNISNSHSTAGTKEGKHGVAGGLVASQQGGAITNSFASGTIRVGQGNSIPGSLAGGLVGIGGGSVTNSFSIGQVSGGYRSAAGGLFGLWEGVAANCYALGSISGSNHTYVGGLVGWDANGNRGTITDSYSTGQVKGRDFSTVGGFAGEVQYSGTTSDDYWDTTTSGTNTGVGSGDATGITGLTSQQLQSGLPQGFDPKIWGQNANVNDGFPYLLANPPPK